MDARNKAVRKHHFKPQTQHPNSIFPPLLTGFKTISNETKTKQHAADATPPYRPTDKSNTPTSLNAILGLLLV